MTGTLAEPQVVVGAVSHAQRRMWVAEQLVDGEPAYNLQLGLRLRGRLDLAALRRAVDEVVARHEGLRTSFVSDDGSLRAVVRPPAPVPVHVVDVAGVPDAIGQRMRAELDVVFAPAQGDTFRVVLLRAAPDDHTLLFTLDHLVGDAWSVQVLHEELTGAYARQRGGTAPVAPPAVTYREYAQWQRDWLAGPECQRQLAYWRGQLPVQPPRLSLPVRPGGRRTGQMRRHSGGLGPGLVTGCAAAARQSRSSLLTVLLAGYAALLGRYGQHEQVMVGSLYAGRTRPEVERVVGFFANSVALRADLAGRPSLRGLVARLREVVLDAYAHQDVPFDHVVAAVQPERAAGQRPFFDTMFQLVDLERPPVELPDLHLEPLPTASRIAGADLVLTVVREHDGYRCHWDYDAGLLDAGTVERMHRHYATLLADALADPDRPLGEIPLVRDEELAAIEGFSAPPLGGDDGWTLPGAFEEVVAAQPDHVALSGPVECSYAELNAAANRLAHALRGRGVGVERLVGLFLDDRADVLTAALAVLKAGGAYLPLDPAYPADRIGYMLDDAVPALVVTRAGLAGRLPAGLPVLVLDEAAAELSAQPADNPVRRLDPDNLAYVIYTSGSTGRPKGVAVVHRGLAAVTAAHRRAFPLGPRDRVLQFASPNFDASILETLMAFGAAATLCLPPAEASAHADLEEMLRATRADAVLLPPSALGSLRPDGPAAALRTITVGGEACPAPLAAKWAPGRRFFNLYGPTEASIVSTSHLVGEAEATTGGLPIGRPLPGVRALVVSDGGALAPVGVPGELLLGGPVLGRGYLGRPGLTAERFVPDPFDEVPGARLYRTGDLVRWRADGVLEFLGRIDHQVKIRGYRIELGEVESCLAGHPAVHDVVVLVRDQRLWAYLAADPQRVPDLDELRGYCARALPEFMVPSGFVVLERLPKTPNGKADRAALADIEPAGDSEYVAPRTELEAACAAIWAEVLGVTRVGAFDDFFERGGHSLAATSVVNRVRRSFDVALPMRTLFDHPVLADFTAAVVRWAAEHG
jgi:amino acid adenylation domain-containing protein